MLHTLDLQTPRSVILILSLTSYNLPLIFSTNSAEPHFDQKLINILPEHSCRASSLMFPVNSKSQSHSHLHFKVFSSHQALVQQLVCSGQAVDTLHMHSQWLFLTGHIPSYSTPTAYEYRLQASLEFGLKHWFGDRAVEETEQFPLRNLQLNWLSGWHGGRVR